ncbi:MAG: CHASE domain-containing protein, partial [Gallionellaceae bacterium]|nr:CHASE domain-containing protein [Gallionellaceae bacterium]
MLTRLRLSRFLPLLVLAVSLGVTYLLWKDARQAALRELQADFDSHVEGARMRVEQRMAAYEQVMRGAKGLFAASRDVERGEFREYVNALRLEENYPGIQALRFVQYVPLAEKERHIAAIRKQGFPSYTIWPEGRRESYAPVAYIEPFDMRNRRAFGYDMYSDRESPLPGGSVGERRAAMEQARDSGEGTSSGKIRLVFENDRDAQTGFVMFLPIYRNGAALDTIEERRANLTGWISSVFRMDDLIDEVLGEHAAEFDIEIYDGGEISGSTLLHDSHAAELRPLFRATRPVEVDDRRWTMVLHSLPAFEARLDREKPQIVANAASGVSLLLTLLAWLLARDQQRTLRTAESLAENEAKLKEMFEHLNSGVAVYRASPDGRDFTITDFNPAAEHIEKVNREEVIGRDVTEAFPGISEMGMLETFRRVWQSGVAEKCPVSFYHDGRISGWRENYVFKLRRGEIVAIYNDVTGRKQAEEQAHYLAHYDVLTDLPNRILITDRIRQALAKARRDRTRMALMFVDLDNFKPVNDKFGHDIGDLLLKEVARRLQEGMRESDTAARIGGDEFIVLLPTIETEQDAMVVAEKICHALCQP